MTISATYPNDDIARASASDTVQGARIAAVEPNTPAYDAGFEAGYIVTSVDGAPVRDIIDWRWLADGESAAIGYIDLDGDAGEVELWREPGQEWGFEFEGLVFDGVRQCRNACTFCFMRQLPAGMRPSLSLRDDDFRLSFLAGTFVTLTNLTPEEEARIIEQRISPLRVSLQASNPNVRARLIGKHARHGLDALDRLLAAGIEFHAQIVLVPGENDGDALVETLQWAYERPGILGIGIVPLGYTRHQTVFDRSFNGKAAAQGVLDLIEPFQTRALAERGEPWVHAADEFYRNAYRDNLLECLPPAGFYGDFAMFEDGIGIIRSTVDDWREADYTWADDHSKVTASHVCSRCKLEESETVVPVVTGRSATCTDAGITVYTATFADKSFGVAGVVADTVHIEPLGHNWDAGVITKKRTCAEDGVRTYTCKRCGTTRTGALPATGHSPAEPVIENEVSATCVKAGSFDEVVYCMSCDKELSRTAKTLPIDPNAHEWAVLDGCDADGWRASQVGDTITERRECKNDPSHFEMRTYKADHVHVYQIVPEQPATCTQAGVKEHYVCTTCKHVFSVNAEGTPEETTLAALAIPAAHTQGEPEREDVSAPTCAEPGEYDMVVHCEDCGAELSREQVAIEPLGHDWGAAAYEWSDDLGSCTATRTCNRGEPHVQVAPGSVTFEMTKEPSATEPGERTYTATFDVDWAQTQTATSEIPPTGEDAIAYQATKGGGTWTKGSGDKLPFTYQRSLQNDLTFSLFTGVLVDGQEVPQGSYDAYSGSVVIELSPNYLETLAVGAHTLQPTFQDGVGDEVSFTIAEAVKPDEGGEVKPDEGGEVKPDEGGSVKPDDKGGSKVDGNGNGDGGSSGGTAASTKPASSTSKGSAASAKTGDALPIAAVCILVVLGLVVAIVAYRKSRK